MSSQIVARMGVVFAVVLSTGFLVFLFFILPAVDANPMPNTAPTQATTVQAQTIYTLTPSFYTRRPFDTDTYEPRVTMGDMNGDGTLDIQGNGCDYGAMKV